MEKELSTIADAFRTIMETLGMDLTDPSLQETPVRVAKMYLTETCASLKKDPPKITLFPNTDEYSQMVVCKDITINNLCEHHFVPFVGKCHIAYIPRAHYVGLSKLNRTAEYFASKPQVQERLGTEIMVFLQEQLQTEDVSVIIECKHFCVCTRGVKDQNSSTITSHLGGVFYQSDVRAELMNLIKLSN